MVSANKIEILRIAEAVAQEKMIDKEIVISALEEAMVKAAKNNYGEENDVFAEIDTETGQISLSRKMLVVDEVQNKFSEISLKDAKAINSAAETGDELLDPLPPLDFGRVAAQAAKQVITSKVREAERARQYDEFKDKIGQIVNGIVKRTEFGNIILDLGKAEGIIKRDQGIPRESLRNGDRVKAYIYEVKSETKGPQIFLSRAHPQFMAMLFTQEVPEIYDGIIEIKKVARDPGSRAKIAVSTSDGSIDPVGACVGMRGSRVQAVVNELQGEKIDIVMWSDNQATFLANALAPAEVSKIFLYEEKKKVEVVIPDEQLSLAIGRRGQNVKLASNLTNLEIDILTEEEEAERRQEEFKIKTEMFVKTLDVEDVIAQLLVTEGYVTVESVTSESIENLEKIEGFDKDLAVEILDRAKNYLSNKEEENLKIINDKNIEEELRKIEGIDNKMLALLAENDVITLDDFAGLSTFDLLDKNEGIFKELDLDEELVNKMIMKARENWFADESVKVKNEDK